MGLFGAVKVAKEVMLAVVVNPRGPASHCLAPRCAKEAALTAISCFALVLPVDGIRDIAQILKSIVAAIAVQVIDVVGRQVSVRKSPRNAMQLERLTINVDALVSMVRRVPDALEKLTGFGVVSELALKRLNVKCLHVPIQGIPVVQARAGMNHLFAPSS